MIRLSHREARPRASRSAPRYPVAGAIGLVTSTLSCAGAGVGPATVPQPAAAASPVSAPRQVPVEAPGATQHQLAARPLGAGSTVVAPNAEPGPSAIDKDPLPGHLRTPPPRLSEALWANPPAFHEDTDPPPLVACGGGCPPPYVLATQAKDRNQIEARVRYCANLLAPYLAGVHGKLNVRASISAAGRADMVDSAAQPREAEPVARCVRALVMRAKFMSEDKWAREAVVEGDIGAREASGP